MVTFREYVRSTFDCAALMGMTDAKRHELWPIDTIALLFQYGDEIVGTIGWVRKEHMTLRGLCDEIVWAAILDEAYWIANEDVEDAWEESDSCRSCPRCEVCRAMG